LILHHLPANINRVKRARDKKLRRAKTIKQLDNMGRTHLLGIRIVLKNMVYVIGMKITRPDDEVSSDKVDMTFRY
jgi:CCR4-NOT transcription complex subunit 4